MLCYEGIIQKEFKTVKYWEGEPWGPPPGGDGSETAHVALAVVQHPDKLPVALTVTGGTFTGGGALLEQNSQNGDPEAAAKIHLDISGGRFHGSLYSENQTGFISGGFFTADPSPYLADGFAAEDSGDAVYHYTVTAAGENPAQVVTGEAEVSVSESVSDGEEQALAQQVAEALKDTQQGGGEKPEIGEALRAAASTVANQNPVTPEQGKQALDDAGIPSGDVTIVVRPYLEISVADVSIQDGNQTVTLDITPKYMTLAATDKDDIKLEEGAGQNAVQMGQPQTLTITKPVTVTLPLTDGFAENGRLYVKHEKNSGAVYYYRGTVADNVLTFTNPNGFSRFSYSTASEVVADIGGRGYPTLEAAVAAVEEGGTIEVLAPYESRSYVDLTIGAMQQFGIKVASRARKNGSVLYRIPAPQRYTASDFAVEGDYSQAAFLAVLGCVIGGITVTGLNPASQQGDKVILEILQRCGGKFKAVEGGYKFSRSLLRATEIDLADCPDLGPVLFTLGCFCSGETVIHNAGRLRLKESDRIEAMQTELQKMGARIEVDGDEVHITGVALHAPNAPLSGHNDHRIVMALAVAACGSGLPALISGAEAVNKSWPAFWDTLRALGAKVEFD